MFELLDTIEARGRELLAGKLFDLPEGGHAEMRWFQLGMPFKRQSTGQGQDYPFCIVRIKGGAEDSASGRLVVRIICGLYVAPDTDGDGDVDAGDNQQLAAKAAMEQAMAALLGLAEDGNYAPYSLEKLKWGVGDEEGQQPQPDYFYLTVDLEFSKEPVFTNF